MISVNAFAKVNLGLFVVGRRPDGFHDLETVFFPIGLHDFITVAPSSSIQLRCDHPSVPTDASNICWKAVQQLQEATAVSSGACISIIKRIPVGAGLGGGSSDGAAVLKTLPSLWGKEVPMTTMNDVALSLGSDVPFFLHEGPAYGEGRGERLTPMTVRMPYWLLLVNPGIHVSTPWAYRRLSEVRNGAFPHRPSLRSLIAHAGPEWYLHAENDFESVVFAEHPEIAGVKEQLTGSGAVVSLMSGSGSSVFGLFQTRAAAEHAAAQFPSHYLVHITDPTR